MKVKTRKLTAQAKLARDEERQTMRARHEEQNNNLNDLQFQECKATSTLCQAEIQTVD